MRASLPQTPLHHVYHTQTAHWQALRAAEMIGGVFNASNTHWASFLVDAQRKSLLIFETARFVSHNFGVVFLRALAQVMDDPQVAHWEVRVLGEKSGIMCQIDGKSCGVYACIILQSVLEGRKLPAFTPTSLRAWRAHMAHAILTSV